MELPATTLSTYAFISQLSSSMEVQGPPISFSATMFEIAKATPIT
jgi:hypothetical protein